MKLVYIAIIFGLYLLLALGIGYLESIIIRKIFPNINQDNNYITDGISVIATFYLSFNLNDIIEYLNNILINY